MNKTAIKNFAVSARKKLIAMVMDKAGIIGITKDEIAEPTSRGNDFAVFPTRFGTETRLSSKELRQRDKLIDQINKDGYDSVMEEAAYTWFNRIIAVRFMEVNNYLPTGVRVLSSETAGKFEPDIVTLAPDVSLGFTDAEVDEIYTLKDDPRKSGELFKKLFIKQCKALGEILPELFASASSIQTDFTEILLDLSWDKEDGVVRELLSIDEADFLEAVEIIGWMYQYYNDEPKQRVFDGLKKNIKIAKESIPAATQLFTPDWIVRYMVENSLGRLWLEGHSGDALRSQWKYYLDEAEQEADVQVQLDTIREACKATKPEDIKIIDPCMGSGHILVYAFDVLMQIYISCAYTKEDAVKLILENNIYGLDIDKRAYQLACFALYMKARNYDRRFFIRAVAPHVYAIEESNGLNSYQQLQLDAVYKSDINYLIDTFENAREYGSILQMNREINYAELYEQVNSQNTNGQLDFEAATFEKQKAELLHIITLAELLSQKYDVVVTNPPYMGSKGMGSKLAEYVKKNYPDSKSDLFAVFIEKCGQMAKQNGYYAMITQHAWMFLASFEKLRGKLLLTDTVNMAHLGAKAFEEIGGEVVQTTSFVMRKSRITNYKGTYCRLIEPTTQQGKEELFLLGGNRHTAKQENFSKIPGSPIAYWVSENFLEIFENGSRLGEIAKPRQGMKTLDNERFIRIWYEIQESSMALGCKNKDEAKFTYKKWFPINHGGSFRKYYGNNLEVVNWFDDGKEMKELAMKNYQSVTRTITNIEHYFKNGLTWSAISSGGFSIRMFDNGYLFSNAGFCMFDCKIEKYIYGFLSSSVALKILEAISPTLNYNVRDIANLPIIVNEISKVQIDSIVVHSTSLARIDWDSFETSWDFKRHPLVHGIFKLSLENLLVEKYIEASYMEWEKECSNRFTQLKSNEEELNRIFIDIYGLQDELTPEVEDKDVTIRKADLSRDIRSFVSYAVGCMFGRYSLDVDGLAYAGGDWDATKYSTFIPDRDNVLPITDDTYFPDDIVTRFEAFVKTVYGAETLEENLNFIANALGNKGDSTRQVIRNYFLKDFYKDHCKIYQKRPIYWLFDSGKADGFKALVYLHRYDCDTVGRVRADYLHKQQGFLENAIEHCDYILSSSQNARDKADATKKKAKLVKQLAETKLYDQALSHIALQRIPLDLDDGVKVNYEKFQGVEVAREGQKTLSIDLLGKMR